MSHRIEQHGDGHRLFVASNGMNLEAPVAKLENGWYVTDDDDAPMWAHEDGERRTRTRPDDAYPDTPHGGDGKAEDDGRHKADPFIKSGFMATVADDRIVAVVELSDKALQERRDAGFGDDTRYALRFNRPANPNDERAWADYRAQQEAQMKGEDRWETTVYLSKEALHAIASCAFQILEPELVEEARAFARGAADSGAEA